MNLKDRFEVLERNGLKYNIFIPERLQAVTNQTEINRVKVLV